jgi:probable HAF family extracellular repeat protein
LKSGQNFTTIDVPGAIGTEAHGINDAGAIVGTFQTTAGGRHGFLYDGGIFTTIAPPGAGSGGFNDYGALGINNAGQIVGSFEEEILGRGRHGYVYSNGTFTDVIYNSIGDQQSFAINNLGQVAGIYSSPRGYNGYIATPVSEPSIFAWLIAGFMAIAWQLRNRTLRRGGKARSTYMCWRRPTFDPHANAGVTSPQPLQS